MAAPPAVARVVSTTGLIGAALNSAETPKDVPGSPASDAKANFKLGTTVSTDQGGPAVYVRVAAGPMPISPGDGGTYDSSFVLTGGPPAPTGPFMLANTPANPGDYVWFGSMAAGSRPA